jgi:hypothetical protein
VGNPVAADFTVMWVEDGLYLCCPADHPDGVISGWIDLSSDSTIGEILAMIARHNAEHHVQPS